MKECLKCFKQRENKQEEHRSVRMGRLDEARGNEKHNRWGGNDGRTVQYKTGDERTGQKRR